MAKVEIEPRVLKGFRDTLPSTAIIRQRLIRTFEGIFSSFGFAPIDTPALEYAEILLGKGSAETDKQTYRFADLGGRDVALRFDLTVPLARFAAMHIEELGTPFKRYHIAPVWRAEKPQRGRYREFIQCDFDIIGSDSALADAEVLALVYRALTAAEIPHTLRINNRSVLNGLLESLGAKDHAVTILRAIDKLDKLGEDAVRTELQEGAALSSGQIDQIFAYLKLSAEHLTNGAIVSELKTLVGTTERGQLGVQQLETVLSALSAHGVGDENLRIDVSIARGLDYYTGTVFETRMKELPAIGSICSGGRYDDLASLYTKRRLPGVGGSIGLDRVLGAFEELGKISPRHSTAEVFVPFLDQSAVAKALEIATALRGRGISVESSLEVGSLGHQLKYADRKGIRYALIVGERELQNGTCAIKDLSSGEQQGEIPLAEASAVLAARLAGTK